MMPSLCRVQAVLTLVLTLIACQVDISLSHYLICSFALKILAQQVL